MTERASLKVRRIPLLDFIGQDAQNTVGCRFESCSTSPENPSIQAASRGNTRSRCCMVFAFCANYHATMGTGADRLLRSASGTFRKLRTWGSDTWLAVSALLLQVHGCLWPFQQVVARSRDASRTPGPPLPCLNTNSGRQAVSPSRYSWTTMPELNGFVSTSFSAGISSASSKSRLVLSVTLLMTG